MLERLSAGLRPREPRVAVLVPCRVKREGGWTDARIHNVSSRGLMIGLDDAPPRGAYVDIRRGSLVIVGRVMWQRQNFIGVRTQETISAAALVDEPRTGRPRANDIVAERRAGPRLAAEICVARRIERSRQLSRLLQFGLLVCAGMSVAAFAAASVWQVLERPLALVGDAMGEG